jgi:hypothetical protein
MFARIYPLIFSIGASDITVVWVTADIPGNQGNQGIPHPVMSNTQVHVGLHVKCLLLLSEFN